MLGLIGNLSLGETLVIAIIAVLVFGRRLPEVAGRGYQQVRRLRRTLDDMRRETGIDSELRSLQRTVSDAAHEATDASTLPPPAEPRRSRRSFLPEEREPEADAPEKTEDRPATDGDDAERP